MTFTLESFEKQVKEDSEGTGAGAAGESALGTFINRIAVFCGVKEG